MRKIVSALFVMCLFACKGANNSHDVAPKDPNTFEVGRCNIEMVSINAISEVVLGNASSTDNKPHKVSLSSYRIAKHEVTQELFDAVWQDSHHWHFPSSLSLTQRSVGPKKENPADHVSWYETIAFCNMLTLKIESLKDELVYYSDPNFTKAYTKDDAKNKLDAFANWNKKGFRLPTEAEWEVAAKAKDDNAIYSGAKGASDDELKEVAWMGLNSENKTHKVGQKKANALGLFDMTGNVVEWCWDWCNDIVEDLENTQKDPHGTDEQGGALGRAMRGGAWAYSKDECHIAYRDAMSPDGIISGLPESQYRYLGFRLAMSL